MTLVTRTFGNLLRSMSKAALIDLLNATPPAIGTGVANVCDPQFAGGADRTGATDSSDAINSALESGLQVVIPPGDYKATDLAQTVDYQSILAHGARITKSGNGALFASTGQGVQVYGLQWRGDASTPVYSGDNATFSGTNVALYGCGSLWAYGRALKLTGGQPLVMGTNGLWQTADQSASGYDIEVGVSGGVSGAALLYPRLFGVYTGQSTGGLKFTDTGAHQVVGFIGGKVTIAAGTSPSGTGGGSVTGSRILGAVDVWVSNSNFANTEFGAVAITFHAGTAGCRISPDCVFGVGYTITDAGNVNNLILREVTTVGFSKLKWGPDSSSAELWIDRTPGTITAPNGLAIGNVGGTPNVRLTAALKGTVAWNPGSLLTGAQQTTTVTVTGAALGDSVQVSLNRDLLLTQLTGYVSASNTVTVVHRNGTAGTVAVGSGGTLTALVTQSA